MALMLFPASVTLPPRFSRRFRLARGALLIVVIAGAAMLTIRSLFPTLEYRFDFSTPQSTRNNFLDPRAADGSSNQNGKIDAKTTLTGNIGAYGAFDHGEITITLEKKSAPADKLTASLRRGYRGALASQGSPREAPPLAFREQRGLYLDDAGHYFLIGSDGMSHRFVSTQAFASRFAATEAQPIAVASPSVLTDFPLSKIWAGFRPGTLLSFADGVFIVTSDTEIRPFGDAEIFLRMGYRFADVLPATAEEIGIYERGRIILPGAMHPDGTLFEDENGQLLTLERGRIIAVTDPTLARFLAEQQTPIRTDRRSIERRVGCSLAPAGFFSPRTYICPVDVSLLSERYGSDFETLITSDQPINIREIRIDLRTARTGENFSGFLGDIKRRLLTRFGYEL